MRVAGKGAVRRGNEDAPQFVGIAGPHLGDPRIVGPRGKVGAPDQIELGGEIAVEIDGWGGIQAWCLRLRETLHRLLCGAARDQCGSARCAQQAIGGQVVGISVSGALTAYHADAAAGAHALARRLHERLVYSDRGRGDRLKIEVGIVTSCGKSLTQATLKKPLGDAKLVEEILLVLQSGGCRR